MAVVIGSVVFALLTTLIALIVRRVKQRKNEEFEKLEAEVT